MVWPGKDLS
jgi:hypothetical protein